MSKRKTPVTLLQEYCDKKKISVPCYVNLPEETYNCNKRIFSIRCSAVSQTTIGKGLSKKNAKHHAAANVLQLIGEKTDYVNDLEASPVEFESPVAKLMEFCKQRKLPLPEFSETQSTGPPHCPEFTIQCKISTVACVAKASSKSKAKAEVATLVLNILQEIQMENHNEVKIMEIKKAMKVELKKENDIVRIYREYKKLQNKEAPGVHLSDRHNFWVNLGKEKVEKAKRCLTDENETISERIGQAMSALEVKFQLKDVPSNGERLRAFELQHPNYECFFVSRASKFWSDLHQYFLIMLNVVQYKLALQSFL